MNLARENFLQDLNRLAIWYGLRQLNRCLSLKVNLALFEALGDLAYIISPEKRTLLAKRMAAALPHLAPEAIRAEVLASFRNYFVDRLIINLIPSLNRARLEQMAFLEGEEYLREALALGRGVVLAHPHFGPSQLPLIFLGYRGYAIAQMGLRANVDTSAIGLATQRLRLKLEHRMPVTHFFADNYLRPVLRWLEHGRILMTAGDGTGLGRQIGKFHPVGLLGHSLDMPLGPYRLAASNQSPLLTVIALRQRCGWYRIVIQPFPADLRDPKAAQRQFAAWFEPYLAQAPGQWHFWDEWDLEAETGSEIQTISEGVRLQRSA